MGTMTVPMYPACPVEDQTLVVKISVPWSICLTSCSDSDAPPPRGSRIGRAASGLRGMGSRLREERILRGPFLAGRVEVVPPECAGLPDKTHVHLRHRAVERAIAA